MVNATTRFAGVVLADWITRVQSLICSAGVAAASLAHQPSSLGDWASAGPARHSANVRPASRRNALFGMRTSVADAARASGTAPRRGVSTFRGLEQPARLTSHPASLRYRVRRETGEE